MVMFRKTCTLPVVAGMLILSVRVAAASDATPVDAAPLLRNTYYGSTGLESAFGTARAADGTYYITGMTNSTDLPGVNGGVQPAYGGGSHDIFVAHFSADLHRLLQATYLGGTGDDRGYAVAISPSTRYVYVVGSTKSSGFPFTAGSAQARYGGNGDTVVIELTANLTHARATYLGGSGDDTPDLESKNPDQEIAIAIAPDSGAVYVSGITTSVDFPHVEGGAQPAYGGGSADGYVAALSPDLKTFIQATYLGGSGPDAPYALAVSPVFGVYVAGSTQSSDFPGTAGGAQATFGGVRDAFVAHLDPGLQGYVESTYLGGTRIDDGRSIAVDDTSGIVYLAGNTLSRNVPFTDFGAQPTYGGGGDGFVAALSPDLSTVSNASYLGGTGLDLARPSSLVVNPVDGEVYVAGTTTSQDFPSTAGGVQSNYPGLGNNGYDSFISEFTPDLTRLVQSTYFGGSISHTGIHALIADPDTGALVAAFGSGTPDLPNTDGAYQPFFAGGSRDAGVGSFPPDLLHP